jgi:hypothetical protein
MSIQPQWDGTFLGKINKTNILQIIKFKKDTYWKIKIGEMTFHCLAKQSKNTYPCIIDELKYLFKIPKLGTHYCKINSKIYILVRVLTGNIYDINVDVKLNELQYDDPLFMDKVRRIYAFRELLGITVSTDNSIRVRERYEISENNNLDDELKGESDLDFWDPISFREPNFNFEKSIISKKVLKKLFHNQYQFLLGYVYNLLNFNTQTKLPNGKTKCNLKNELLKLSSIIDDVITRIDKSNGLVNHELMMRFNSFY